MMTWKFETLNISINATAASVQWFCVVILQRMVCWRYW